MTDEDKQEEFNRKADRAAGDCLSWGCFFGPLGATSALAIPLLPLWLLNG